ncbi:capsular polysaccharide export protein, LipB/KpsS family [Pedobacter cryoconitis]|uniref:Capsular polysaccharide biosynthesis protein n=1 Tax=Pedobacter cryoconitis TaxID=188932 RepID=A0A327SYF2_9SPHI|nr:CDP-glycerol glycerophosphotransferase family protein [Pedobacter cryoconitis]RAJ33462.1 capsular polysaccharide biosynthesis protein [Pedobacter cryoconitis]
MRDFNKKPIVLFFSREYQSQFFPTLVSDKYDSIHVTLSIKEKRNVESRGGIVVGCLEEMYGDLAEANIVFPYLDHSMGSDRYIVGHSHMERLAILKKCVTFWRDIYNTYQPHYVINEVVALEISEIMYIEARVRNIRYLAFGAFPVKKSFYWHDNPFHSSMPEKIQSMIPSEQDLIDAQAYMDKVNSGPIDNPFIKEYKLGKDFSRLKELFKHLLYSIYIRLKIGNKVIRQVCYGNAIGYYITEIKHYFNYILKDSSYDDMNDLNKDDKCIFYPMHFEPEATLFYMSTYYDNQLALVENLLKCLSEDQFLLVKEHPAQAGFLTQKIWLKLKNRFPNAKFIKAEVSSKEIIVRSDVVITLVSTAGFEAMILDKPVIVLGKIYFDAFDGVNHCETFEEIYDLLRGKKEFKQRKSIHIYLAKLIAMQNVGNPWPHDGLYSAKNIADIRMAIERGMD